MHFSSMGNFPGTRSAESFFNNFCWLKPQKTLFQPVPELPCFTEHIFQITWLTCFLETDAAAVGTGSIAQAEQQFMSSSSERRRRRCNCGWQLDIHICVTGRLKLRQMCEKRTSEHISDWGKEEKGVGGCIYSVSEEQSTPMKTSRTWERKSSQSWKKGEVMRGHKATGWG